MPYDLTFDSRFRHTQRIIYDNKNTFGLWEAPAIFDKLSVNDIVEYVVESGYEGRPDLIAQKFYGSPNYYWILVMFNKPIDTIGWPPKKSVIKIPAKAGITGLL